MDHNNFASKIALQKIGRFFPCRLAPNALLLAQKKAPRYTDFPFAEAHALWAELFTLWGKHRHRTSFSLVNPQRETTVEYEHIRNTSAFTLSFQWQEHTFALRANADKITYHTNISVFEETEVKAPTTNLEVFIDFYKDTPQMSPTDWIITLLVFRTAQYLIHPKVLPHWRLPQKAMDEMHVLYRKYNILATANRLFLEHDQ